MPQMIKLASTAFAFALLGGIARHFHLHTESRLQIFAFWGLALFYEVELRAMAHSAPSILGFVINGCAATFSIITVKFIIEGLPHWLP